MTHDPGPAPAPRKRGLAVDARPGHHPGPETHPSARRRLLVAAAAIVLPCAARAQRSAGPSNGRR